MSVKQNRFINMAFHGKSFCRVEYFFCLRHKTGEVTMKNYLHKIHCYEDFNIWHENIQN